MRREGTLPPRCGRDYEIQETLGSGQSGVVHRALQRSLGRAVALKLPRPGDSFDEDQLRRFVQEARITSTLRHLGIVLVLDHDVEDGVPWIAYELVTGVDLRTVMQEREIGIDAAIEITLQLARALEEAHGRGILHRDIKPENVLEAGPSWYKLADFGIAKWSGSTVETAPGVLVGSPAYMAPERLRGEEAMVSSDLYSLGIVLFELLARRRPYPGYHPAAILAQQEADPSPHPSTHDSRVPPALDRIVTKLLALSPGERFPSARELIRALVSAREEMERSRDTHHTPPAVPVHETGAPTASLAHPPVTENRRRPGRYLVPALVVAVLATYPVLDGWRRASTPVPASPGRPATPVPERVRSDFRQPIPGPRRLMLDMIAIPGGSFAMGSGPGEGSHHDKPARMVQIRPFYLSRCEISRSQLAEVVTGKGTGPADGKLPASPVSLAGAIAFCDELARVTGRPFRLPSEAEWEYACRAGSTAPYFFGHDPAELGRFAWYLEDSTGRGEATHPFAVGQKAANPWGLHDMLGNVHEWTADDWHDDYRGAPLDGTPWTTPGVPPSGVLRGSSYENRAEKCRVFVRYRPFSEDHPEVFITPAIGFRVACSEGPGTIP